MQELFEKVKKIVELGGFQGVETHIDEEHRKISFMIEDRVVSENVTTFLPALDHLLGLIFRKEKQNPFVIDVNYYRKERERLISELARAAAKKAIITKQDVELPSMNGYERRLVHMEIATHPELRTESTGEGKERRVVIRRIE
jgi:predicted RNA-binding protein Jag